MTVILKILNFFGAGLCHQQASRSFEFDGLYMPMCSRCTGIYIGFLFSLAAVLIIERRTKGEFPSVKTALVTIGIILIMGLDVVVSTLKIYSSNNYIRCITGFLVGWFLAPVMLSLKNILMWEKLIKKPYLNSKKYFFIWLVCGITVIVAFMFSYGKILIFWGFSSILGTITMIAFVALILFFAVCRKLANSINSWKYYFLSLAAGVAAGTGFLGLFSAVREFLI